jgi:hypothetical protein
LLWLYSSLSWNIATCCGWASDDKFEISSSYNKFRRNFGNSTQISPKLIIAASFKFIITTRTSKNQVAKPIFQIMITATQGKCTIHLNIFFYIFLQFFWIFINRLSVHNQSLIIIIKFLVIDHVVAVVCELVVYFKNAELN